MKKSISIPFDFVLEHLYPLAPTTKPMFGCHAVYASGKIMLILRHKEDYPDDNGVWIATKTEHHSTLKKIFPSLRSIQVLGNGTRETNWQILPEDADDFEESVLTVCDLILKGDVRIGNVPKARKKSVRPKRIPLTPAGKKR